MVTSIYYAKVKGIDQSYRQHKRNRNAKDHTGEKKSNDRSRKDSHGQSKTLTKADQCRKGCEALKHPAHKVATGFHPAKATAKKAGTATIAVTSGKVGSRKV